MKTKIPLSLAIKRIAFFLFMLLLCDNLFAQISVDIKDKPIKEALKEIETRSTFKFFYNNDLKDLEKIISIKTKNSSIDTILKLLFPECRNAINKVRDRESVKMPALKESGDQLLEKRHNERRIKLAFENHRYLDLRRWRIAEVYENIDAKGIEGVKKEDGTFTYNPITVLERTFLPQHYLLPIPRSEIIKSNNSLIQNPYYN